jgi:formate dehydrogenase major subunit
MEARARGAKVIHVDPRFTRTSAVADLHVPLRAGSDIAFLGGIINYVISEEKYFREYVAAYTNGPTIITDQFAGPEDLAGVFSGLEEDERSYDFRTWEYEGVEVQAASGERDQEYEDRAEGGGDSPEGGDDGPDRESDRAVGRAGRGESHGSGGAMAHPSPRRDETMQHPRCVFQILKRHFSRYTPEMVEQICGIPQDQFRSVCETITANSGRDRTTAFVYSVGWT